LEGPVRLPVQRVEKLSRIPPTPKPGKQEKVGEVLKGPRRTTRSGAAPSQPANSKQNKTTLLEQDAEFRLQGTVFEAKFGTYSRMRASRARKPLPPGGCYTVGDVVCVKRGGKSLSEEIFVIRKLFYDTLQRTRAVRCAVIHLLSGSSPTSELVQGSLHLVRYIFSSLPPS